MRDVPVGSVVTLAIVTADAGGHGWRSSADYRVGAGGLLDLEDPDRPWWDMGFNDARTLPVAFTSPTGSLRYRVSATFGGESAIATTTRHWGRGISTEDLSGEGWRLRIFRPAAGRRSRVGVVVIPGSTGLAAAAPTAALLASHGYTAAVLAYLQEPGLPASFARIALESINEGLHAFAGLEAVERVVVLAQSVGTSVALSALTRPEAPAVEEVILVAPTHVVWQALGPDGQPPKHSSLTLGGRDLNYVPIQSVRLLPQVMRKNLLKRFSERRRSAAMVMLPAYQMALKTTEAVTAAGIPVERINAPLLMIAGEDDHVWPSVQMAKALVARRGDRPGDTLLLLAGAGHFLRAPVTPSTVARNESLVSGGTPAGIAAGQRVAWEAILTMLSGLDGASGTVEEAES